MLWFLNRAREASSREKTSVPLKNTLPEDGLSRAAENMHERAFSWPGGTGNAHHLTFMKGEVDTFQHFQFTCRGNERLARPMASISSLIE